MRIFSITLLDIIGEGCDDGGDIAALHNAPMRYSQTIESCDICFYAV